MLLDGLPYVSYVMAAIYELRCVSAFATLEDVFIQFFCIGYADWFAHHPHEILAAAKGFLGL